MQTYQIQSPYFCAGVVVSHDFVLQAAPIIRWAIGKSFIEVRDYCRMRGWTIEPCHDDPHPVWLEYDGSSYELLWDGDRLRRIISYNGDGEPKELTLRQLPECLKQLINMESEETE